MKTGKRKGMSMPSQGYTIVAEGIRRIEDEAMRKVMANHFAKFFHSRSESFDPQIWYEKTGGLVNPK